MKIQCKCGEHVMAPLQARNTDGLDRRIGSGFSTLLTVKSRR